MDSITTDEQITPHFGPRRSKKAQLPQKTSLACQDQQVPGGDDDDDVLPAHCRFADLQRAQIVSSWVQLKRLVDEQGFPPGRLLSPNVRVFSVGDVRRWLASRPAATTKEDA